jgi:hypothetical protein
MMHLRLPVLLLGSVAAAWAADRPPFYLAGGIGYLNAEARELTTSKPWHAAAGWGEAAQALLGAPSIDLDWTHAAGRGNSLDTAGVTYNERVPLSDSLYLGYGIGSFYNRLTLTDSAGDKQTDNNWTIGGIGRLGIYLGGGSYGSLFVEASYLYRGKIDGVNLSGAAFTLGLWF